MNGRSPGRQRGAVTLAGAVFLIAVVSVLLAAAGLADGANVTTHWLARDMIDDDGPAHLVDEGFVEYGRLLTASGLVSTASLAFRLVGALKGGEMERDVRARYQPAEYTLVWSGMRVSGSRSAQLLID